VSAALLYLVLRRLVDTLRSERQLEERVRELEAKVLALQKQVEILERKTPRPKYARLDRILLAALSRVIPRAEWSVFLVTPQTLLRWHRELVARKWTFRHDKAGRPRIAQGIEALIVSMAKDNSNWGYWRIRDELAKLGILVSKTTLRNVMARNGIPPAPRRDGEGYRNSRFAF
jgi:putative transposase